jgi:hypothetical protein
VNGIGSHRISWLDNGDSRFSLFELDGQIEIYRSAPGMGLDWYLEYEGFHRGELRELDDQGQRHYTVYGVGYNHLLSRRVIAYRSGTIRAEKNDHAESVMKEYVSENAGVDANHASRIRDGVFTGFTTDAVGADHEDTPIWAGDKSFANLLDALREISEFSHGAATALIHGLDFNVVGTGPATFTFYTYLNQLGTDRTSGSASPVTFSAFRGNMQNSAYEVDRSKEANCAIVLGQGDRSTRTVIYREDAVTKADSVWNDIEIARPATLSEFTYQLNNFGDALIAENYMVETVDGTPMQSPGEFYGQDYFIGDLVTVEHDDVSVEKQIVTITINVDGSTLAEAIQITFADV